MKTVVRSYRSFMHQTGRFITLCALRRTVKDGTMITIGHSICTKEDYENKEKFEEIVKDGKNLSQVIAIGRAEKTPLISAFIQVPNKESYGTTNALFKFLEEKMKSNLENYCATYRKELEKKLSTVG